MTHPDHKAQEKRSRSARRSRRWLVGMVAILLVLLIGGIVFLRPAARLNRLFVGVGLAELPSSTRHLKIGKRGRFFGTQTIYVRFEADANDVARFVANSPMTTSNEPAFLANIAFGPRCPDWMTWDTAVNGRMYHGLPDNTSVWLAIDDDAHTIYVGVFEFRPLWLRRLLD